MAKLPDDIRDMIHTELDRASEAGPEVVADKVAAGLSREQVQAVVRPLLRDAVRNMIQHVRMDQLGNGAGAVGELTCDPDRMQHFVPGKGWVFDADLTADDCDAIADMLSEQAAALKARAEWWRTRADRMRGGTV